MNTEKDYPYKKELEEIQVVKKENNLEQATNRLKFNESPRIPTFLLTKHPTSHKKDWVDKSISRSI